MKKRIMAFAIFSIILILGACSDSEEESKEEENHIISVEVSEVKKGDLKSEKSLYGETQPIKQTPIMLSAPGEVDELYVDNNDKVEKNKNLATVKSEMGNQTIKAPSKGIVAGLPATGTFVSGEEPFAMIIDTGAINVQATMTKKTRDLFKKDQKVSVDIDGEAYDGEVLALDPLPNEQGELVLNIRVENEDEKITTGESARITVNKTLEKDVLIVPTEAVITTDEESYIYIIEDSKAKQVTVEVLESQSTETAIKADVKKNQEVVVTGQSLLAEDQEVNVQKDGDNS